MLMNRRTGAHFSHCKIWVIEVDSIFFSSSNPLVIGHERERKCVLKTLGKKYKYNAIQYVLTSSRPP